ncbi:DNA repair protein RecN [Ferruginibacter sp. HRS2-29]|uniref:DNA repair protein RecN n=1 Tax=Ferruginibacter sp. HRS2-29 TaxID=2487334 RepID=UPI0020CC7572|nr:DNA repair protein RecN [Ferruginibacter sp. HRS2-29]MCP9750246.1 DNA repair protein RecN [Ferruginibacter sp. HRS2-29]
MLQRLHIRNYAIIEELSISFSPQLNIITGETGAGKSILMGALNLILGQRADSNVLQDKEQKCIVEAVFALQDSGRLQQFFKENDLDFSEEILVRREIAVNGKSRGFVNDTPVNLSQLKELSLLLVDLHQQFDTLELGNENFQREVLDALANNSAQLAILKENYSKYIATKNELEELHRKQLAANKELDYNQFLFEELETLSLKQNELEELEAELKLLNNSENIKQQLGAIYFEIKDSDEPIVQQLKVLQHKLNSLQQYHPSVESLCGRMNSSILELQDVAEELEQIDSNIQFDAQRIQKANDRLSEGYKLLKKHGVNETSQLLEIQQVLQQKLDDVLNASATIEALEKETATLYGICESIAGKISAARSAQVKSFTDKVNKLLVQVGMPNAQLKVLIQPAKLSVTGMDEIGFLFDANKSNRFEPLHKVASGGELSRLMLSIKSLVAKKLQLPTLIFDEIDTGISGEAARQVGIIMKELSAGHQLIVISHQPQIAAKASAHYFVYKAIVKDKIATSIRLLDNDERITAIAKMLSGEKPTAAALENAREMVSN